MTRSANAPFARRLALRTLFALGLALMMVLATSCGDEESEDGCPSSGQQVAGIQGVVMTPNCAAPVSSATITARSGAGSVITTTSAADGSFAFSTAEIPEEGRWQLSVVKGPFQGDTIETTTLSDGFAGFVVLKLGS